MLFLFLITSITSVASANVDLLNKPARVSGAIGPSFFDKVAFYYPVLASLLIALIVFYVIIKAISNRRRKNEFMRRYKDATNKRSYNLKQDYVSRIEDAGEKMRRVLELERQRVDNLLDASTKVMTRLEALIKHAEYLMKSQKPVEQPVSQTDNLAYLRQSALPAKTQVSTSYAAGDGNLRSDKIPHLPDAKNQMNNGKYYYKKIYHLNDQGWKIEDIASTVGLGKNIVGLILSMRRKEKKK